MKLYRFVHKDELEMMKNEDLENLGRKIGNVNLANTHHYKQGKRYLHFFYNKEGCQNIIDNVMFKRLEITKTGIVKNYYICTFEIPLKHLIFNTGRGFYGSLTELDHGYDQVLQTRFEAAIPSDVFEKSWLRKVEPAIFEKGLHKKDVVTEEREF